MPVLYKFTPDGTPVPTQYTPGPWRVERPTLGLSVPLIQGANWSGEIAVLCRDPGDDQMNANAALIAAAPTLRELLADLVECNARMGGFDSEHWARARHLLDVLRDHGA